MASPASRREPDRLPQADPRPHSRRARVRPRSGRRSANREFLVRRIFGARWTVGELYLLDGSSLFVCPSHSESSDAQVLSGKRTYSRSSGFLSSSSCEQTEKNGTDRHHQRAVSLNRRNLRRMRCRPNRIRSNSRGKLKWLPGTSCQLTGTSATRKPCRWASASNSRSNR